MRGTWLYEEKDIEVEQFSETIQSMLTNENINTSVTL